MGLISLPKPPASDAQTAASLPWEGVIALSGHWAGTGSHFDWIAPNEWDIDRAWTADTAKARMAEAILLYVRQHLLKHLPRHSGEWLDVLSQQTYRQISYGDAPSAHTDWAATISTFGRYPSEAYIDRKPAQTYDTSFTRLLGWTARSIIKANNLVRARFGRDALPSDSMRRFSSALELQEVQAVPIEEKLSDHDLEICRYAGGVWLTMSRIAGLVSALWSGNPTAQLLAMKPILPEFAHQLFELGVLGTLAAGLRRAASNQKWSSASPLAAAGVGRPSLILQSDEGIWEAFYQSIPSSQRRNVTPYRHLTAKIDGGSLRPDIWIRQVQPSLVREVVFECKYSLNPAYICTGVPQMFAYLVEFPPEPGVQRLHVVVGPEEVVPTTQIWGAQFAVTNPSGAKEICRRAFLSANTNFLEGLHATT